MENFIATINKSYNLNIQSVKSLITKRGGKIKSIKDLDALGIIMITGETQNLRRLKKINKKGLEIEAERTMSI